jgi:LCP family protein required for cell wall assembly
MNKDRVINLKQTEQLADNTEPVLPDRPIKLDDISKPKEKLNPLKIIIAFLLFIVIGYLVFTFNTKISGQSSDSWFARFSLLGQIQKLTASPDKQLKGEGNDRINILLLGMGGKNHDGGNLTDTIMLVSLQPSTNRVAMVSIPRDTAIPMENMGWRKINNVNAYAEIENPGSGGVAISQTISDLFKIPIDYYIRVDFEAFVDIVDQLGGLEINVDNTFDDYSYPAWGKEDAYPYESRYEHLHFDQGLTEMDGSLALKYVRSRHAFGIEGSDFARAKRQQKIIQAIKDKVLSMHILFKPKIITDIIGTIQDHITTNLKVWEMVKIWEMFKDVETKDIINKVLNNSPEGLLTDTISPEGAYLLMPRSGKFTEIEYLVNNVFEQVPNQEKEKVEAEKAKVEILNGTWINGLASRVAVDLEKYGFNIVRVSNSERKDFEKNVIYIFNNQIKNESLNILKDKMQANVAETIPEWLSADIGKNADTKSAKPDFILVLGQAADITASGADNIQQ